MSTKVVIALAFLALAHCKDVIQGTGGDRKIYNETKEANPTIWRQEENVTVTSTDNEVISGVIVTDLRPEKDGDARIVEGGVGQKKVIVELKSPSILRGYTFHIDVYTEPEEGFNKTVDELSHPAVVGQNEQDGVLRDKTRDDDDLVRNVRDTPELKTNDFKSQVDHHHSNSALVGTENATDAKSDVKEDDVLKTAQKLPPGSLVHSFVNKNAEIASEIDKNLKAHEERHARDAVEENQSKTQIGDFPVNGHKTESPVPDKTGDSHTDFASEPKTIGAIPIFPQESSSEEDKDSVHVHKINTEHKHDHPIDIHNANSTTTTTTTTTVKPRFSRDTEKFNDSNKKGNIQTIPSDGRVHLESDKKLQDGNIQSRIGLGQENGLNHENTFSPVRQGLSHVTAGVEPLAAFSTTESPRPNVSTAKVSTQKVGEITTEVPTEISTPTLRDHTRPHPVTSVN